MPARPMRMAEGRRRTAGVGATHRSPSAVSRSESRIGVEAAKEVIPKESEDDRAKDGHQEPCGARAVPAALRTGMEVDGSDEPGQERRRLLGIPAPVGAPRFVGPYGAENE